MKKETVSLAVFLEGIEKKNYQRLQNFLCTQRKIFDRRTWGSWKKDTQCGKLCRIVLGHMLVVKEYLLQGKVRSFDYNHIKKFFLQTRGMRNVLYLVFANYYKWGGKHALKELEYDRIVRNWLEPPPSLVQADNSGWKF